MKNIVITFGRMNPPTVGHQKLVQKVQSVAKANNADSRIYLSHTQNNKKDPLTYAEKISLARAAFGNIVVKSNSKTIIEVSKELEKSGYTDLILVVGSDRIAEFEKLLGKYNGKEYNFNSIKVVSAGERDPDAEGVEGMSASKLRKLALSGDYEAFSKGLPPKVSDKMKKQTYDKIREVIKEETELEEDRAPLTVQQRMQRSRTFKRIQPKLQRFKKMRAKRMADEPRIKKKAQKAAIAILRKKVAGERGSNYANLSVGDKMAIDRMIAKKASVIQKLAKRLIPKIRKQEIERVKQARQSTNEQKTFSNLKKANLEIQKDKENNLRKYDAIRDRARIKDTAVKNRQKMQTRSEESGIDLSVIEEVYTRGIQEYPSDSKLSAEQYAFNRVNSFIAKGAAWELDSDLREANGLEDACWKGYEAVGTKKKNGKTVPNCVPKEESGAGCEGTDKLVKKYKKDTPMEDTGSMKHHQFQKSFKHARQHAMKHIDKDVDGDVDNLDDNPYVPDEITGTEKKDLTKKMFSKFRKEKQHTKKGDAFEELELGEAESCCDDCDKYFDHIVEEAEHQGRKVKLNDPFRTPGGPKKFSVYVKNDKGNVVKVNFGDPNMEIKRDDPERRKNFRARHNCDNPGPKWKARYWSCRMWAKGQSVSDLD